MTDYPSPELVGTAFLQLTLPTYGISTTLPKLTVPDARGISKDNWGGKSTWITIRPAGGAPIPGLPMRNPVLRIHCWAKPSTPKDRTFWGLASKAAQDVISMATDWYSNVTLEMPFTGYHMVSLSNFGAVTDGKRIEDDPQGLAHYVVDVELTYTILTTAPFWTHPDVVVDLTDDTGPGEDYLLVQKPTASMSWNIQHDFGYYPQITVLNTNDEEIDAHVSHLSVNQALVQFNQPTSGSAIVE